MKHLLFLVLVALSACSDPNALKVAWTHDQCLRADLFKSCMAALPAGPVATKYNDWDDVVDSCAAAARDQSVRLIEQVKPECRESQ